MFGNLTLSLPVVITKQGKRFIAYTPALDISTSGTSLRDVQKKFAEAAPLFLEELHDAGTLDDVLIELGWKKTAKKWAPPAVVNSHTIGFRAPAFA